MRLFQAWSESLSLFKPDALKPFLLVTLKSIIETYKVLFTKFWVVLVAPLIFMFIARFASSSLLHPIAGGIFLGLFAFCILCWLFLVLVSARPSVGIKNWRYVFNYWCHFIYISSIVFIVFTIFEVNKYEFLSLFFKIYLIFFIAFLLDSNAQIKSAGLSFYRAGKMFLYNLPFLVIVGTFSYVLSRVFSCLYSLVLFSTQRYSLIVGLYIGILLFPVVACFYINFYVKKIHEQFSLYFPTKGT